MAHITNMATAMKRSPIVTDPSKATINMITMIIGMKGLVPSGLLMFAPIEETMKSGVIGLTPAAGNSSHHIQNIFHTEPNHCRDQ